MAKSYVQNSSVTDLDFKQSVRAATTADITLSGTQTVDGVVLSAGDRVLVKNQSTTSQNGIYDVQSSSWTRSVDSAGNSEITSGLFVSVEEGSVNADTMWQLSTNNPITVDTTGLTFSRVAPSSKTIQRFTARDNQPPASNFATLDTRNSVLVLEFDAATEESAVFVGVINEAATLTSGLVVRIWWMADTATSGNVRWGVQFEKTGTDMDADSYDSNAQVTSAASATSGIESVAEITITTIDSLAAGDRLRLRVYRVAADATNDTMTGDAQLVAVEVRAA